DRALRPHHRVPGPGVPVGVQRRAVPAPDRMAVRGPHRMGAADGRPRRHAGRQRGEGPHARQVQREPQDDRPRSPHADRHVAPPAGSRDAGGVHRRRRCAGPRGRARHGDRRRARSTTSWPTGRAVGATRARAM
ncbi:MAG: hypothetical protein AVDCRST_MAG85-4299, partial [uncultured Solirubrobacteraceae bacterium]